MDLVNTFMATYHTMVLEVLRAKAARVGTRLFSEPSKTCRAIQYLYMQLYGPLPRPDDRTPFAVGPVTNNEWRWDQGFCHDLVRWVNELIWIPGKGQVSFMELSMDFECYAGRSLPASPQAVYRATALPLPERARVLKLALATLQKHAVSGHVFLGGVLTRCASIVPLGGTTVVGVLARPHFTRRSHMLELVQNLQAYCEGRWVSKLSAQTLSPATCQRRDYCSLK